MGNINIPSFSINDNLTKYNFSFKELRSAIEYVTGSYLFFIEIDTKNTFCSENFQKKFFHHLPKEKYTISDFENIIYENDRLKLRHILSSLFHGKILKNAIDIRLKPHHGKKINWISLRYKLLKNDLETSNVIVGALIPSAQMPHIDELTQIKNSTAFSKVLHDCSSSNNPFALMMLNISNFSMINYQHSRHYGDKVLINFAKYLSKLLGYDERNQCFRISDNTFALIIYDNSPENIDKIYSSIKRHLHIMYNMKASFCVCNYPDNAPNFEELVQLSDYLLIQAKRKSLDHLNNYDQNVQKDFDQYRFLQNNLRRSIENNFQGFQLYYQPYIDIQKNCLVGVEALSRYTDENGNFVSPEKFIPIIENMKMMCQFGRWIVVEAINAIKEFQNVYPNIVVNINISHEQLEDKDLFDFIIDTAESIGIDTSHIELEFTEHFLSKEYSYINSAIEKIHKKGILIAMDDFGTGYSSLGFLKDINIDIVKIDKVFVKNFMNDDVKKFFLECIINLCKKLNRKTILEGVEHKEEYLAIRHLGIDMVQGYYYSKPQSFNNVLRFLKEQKKGKKVV